MTEGEDNKEQEQKRPRPKTIEEFQKAFDECAMNMLKAFLFLEEELKYAAQAATDFSILLEKAKANADTKNEGETNVN